MASFTNSCLGANFAKKKSQAPNLIPGLMADLGFKESQDIETQSVSDIITTHIVPQYLELK